MKSLFSFLKKLILFLFIEALFIPCFAHELSLTNVVHPELIIESHLMQIDFRAERAYSVGQSSTPTLDHSTSTLTLPGIVRLSELTKSYKLNFTKIFLENIQIGFSLPIVTKTDRGSELSHEKTAIGDLRLFGAYQLNEDYSSKPFSPQILIYSSFKIPTGNVLFEVAESPLSDAIGIGSYEWMNGVYFGKRKSNFDFFSLAEISLGLERSLASSQTTESIEISGVHSGKIAIGSGVRMIPDFPLRFGTSLTSSYTSDRILKNSKETLHLPSLSRLEWAVDAQFQWNPLTLVMAQYSDESLMGLKKNPVLQKKFELSVSTRWDR